MKQAIYRLAITAAEVASVWLWCFHGVEGAGNVFAVWAWVIFAVALFGLSDRSIHKMAATPENCKPMFWRWFTVVPLSAACIWFGHIATGLAFLTAHAGLAAARATALEKAQSAKEAMP